MRELVYVRKHRLRPVIPAAQTKNPASNATIVNYCYSRYDFPEFSYKVFMYYSILQPLRVTEIRLQKDHTNIIYNIPRKARRLYTIESREKGAQSSYTTL